MIIARSARLRSKRCDSKPSQLRSAFTDEADQVGDFINALGKGWKLLARHHPQRSHPSLSVVLVAVVLLRRSGVTVVIAQEFVHPGPLLLAHLIAVFDGERFETSPDRARAQQLPDQHRHAQRAVDRPGTLHDGPGSALKLRESRLVGKDERPILQIRPMDVDVPVER